MQHLHVRREQAVGGQKGKSERNVHCYESASSAHTRWDVRIRYCTRGLESNVLRFNAVGT
jgi:hypothetical protein